MKTKDVEKILKRKIQEASERVNNDTELIYLVRWVLVSAEMQGLIDGWSYSGMGNCLSVNVQVAETGDALDIHTPFK